MRKKHLHFLCDPITKEELTIINPIFDGEEIISGKLCSPSNSYKIVNGIPRFVEENNYSNNFGYQWNRWARIQFEDQNINKPMQGHTTEMFKSITQFTKEKLKDKWVLDIGCGPGRFSDISLNMKANVIALDHSSAIDAAKKNFQKKEADILFIQGDAMKLPIKDGSIDYAFTIGVLHHTPSPYKGTKEAFRVIKKGGEFSLRVYPKKGFYTFPSVRFWRFVFNSLKPIFGYYPPLIYSYFFGSLGYIIGKIWLPLSYPLRIIFPTVWLKDYKWAILDTFDAIATSYQSGHSPEEINNWLKQANFSKINNINGNDFNSVK